MFKKGQVVVRTGKTMGSVIQHEAYTVDYTDHDEVHLVGVGGMYAIAGFQAVGVPIARVPKPIPNYWDIPNWVLAAVIIADIVVTFWKGVLI